MGTPKAVGKFQKKKIIKTSIYPEEEEITKSYDI